MKDEEVEVEVDPTPTQDRDGPQGGVLTGPAPPPRPHPDHSPHLIKEAPHGSLRKI